MSTFTPDPTPQQQRELTLQPGAEDNTGLCPDCGRPLRRIWGYVVDHGETVAGYIVTWMPGRTDHFVAYDLIFGRWDERAEALNRVAIALDMKHTKDGNVMRIVDAYGRIPPQYQLFDRPLMRVEVFASPRAAEVLAVAHVIYANDPRLDDVRKWGTA